MQCRRWQCRKQLCTTALSRRRPTHQAGARQWVSAAQKRAAHPRTSAAPCCVSAAAAANKAARTHCTAACVGMVLAAAHSTSARSSCRGGMAGAPRGPVAPRQCDRNSRMHAVRRTSCQVARSALRRRRTRVAAEVSAVARRTRGVARKRDPRRRTHAASRTGRNAREHGTRQRGAHPAPLVDVLHCSSGRCTQRARALHRAADVLRGRGGNRRRQRSAHPPCACAPRARDTPHTQRLRPKSAHRRLRRHRVREQIEKARSF